MIKADAKFYDTVNKTWRSVTEKVEHICKSYTDQSLKSLNFYTTGVLNGNTGNIESNGKYYLVISSNMDIYINGNVNAFELMDRNNNINNYEVKIHFPPTDNIENITSNVYNMKSYKIDSSKIDSTWKIVNSANGQTLNFISRTSIENVVYYDQVINNGKQELIDLGNKCFVPKYQEYLTCFIPDKADLNSSITSPTFINNKTKNTVVDTVVDVTKNQDIKAIKELVFNVGLYKDNFEKILYLYKTSEEHLKDVTSDFNIECIGVNHNFKIMHFSAGSLTSYLYLTGHPSIDGNSKVVITPKYLPIDKYPNTSNVELPSGINNIVNGSITFNLKTVSGVQSNITVIKNDPLLDNITLKSFYNTTTNKPYLVIEKPDGVNFTLNNIKSLKYEIELWDFDSNQQLEYNESYSFPGQNSNNTNNHGVMSIVRVLDNLGSSTEVENIISGITKAESNGVPKGSYVIDIGTNKYPANFDFTIETKPENLIPTEYKNLATVIKENYTYNERLVLTYSFLPPKFRVTISYLKENNTVLKKQFLVDGVTEVTNYE